jgi:pimeloyl-ACP methyl ester carboxylesterase
MSFGANIGVSLGSLLAQDFALKYPEKTLSLTVLGGYNVNREQKEVAKAQQGELLKWLFKMIFSMYAFRRYAASTTAINPAAQARFYESAKSVTRKSFTVMSGLDKLIANRPDIRRDYPLLILSGEKDLALAVNLTRQWHEEDTESQMQIIENAGHCANMDNPEKFNETLMKFISSQTKNKSRTAKIHPSTTLTYAVKPLRKFWSGGGYIFLEHDTALCK